MQLTVLFCIHWLHKMGNCAFTSAYFLHSKKPVFEGFGTVLVTIHIFHISCKQDFWDSSFPVIFVAELIMPVAITHLEALLEDFQSGNCWSKGRSKMVSVFTQSLDPEGPKLGLKMSFQAPCGAASLHCRGWDPSCL